MTTPHPLAHVLEAAAKDENAKFQCKALSSQDWSVNTYTLQEVLNSPLPQYHTRQWRVYEAPKPDYVVYLATNNVLTSIGQAQFSVSNQPQRDYLVNIGVWFSGETNEAISAEVITLW